MAKPKRKKRSYPPGAEPIPSPASAPGQVSSLDKRPMRWDLIVLFVAITLGGTWLAIVLRPKQDAPRYTFRVLETYPSDASAFTQGLVYDNGILWLGTGRKGQSVVRKTKLETAEVIKEYQLDDDLFGEGIAIHDDKIYQLTWKDETAFVYDRELNRLGDFDYDGEGWGLTSNGSELILSNGSSELQFIDPENFQVLRTVRVRRGGIRVGQLNELEYVNGNIYANCYQTDFLYEIDPNNGEITAVIDLTGLWPLRQRPADGVLNGIAFNPESRKLLVTGKLCPHIWEIELIPVD